MLRRARLLLLSKSRFGKLGTNAGITMTCITITIIMITITTMMTMMIGDDDGEDDGA